MGDAAPGRDLRTMVVKLLKAHHLRYMNFWQEPDPQTGVSVTLLKFRRDKEHNPKAFFDGLNEVGLQYKKLSKDPNALEITCEIWPKGQKQKMTEMRENASKGVGTGGGEDGGDSSGISNGSLRYLSIPDGEANAKMIESMVQEMEDAGFAEEANELRKIAFEQNWDEFRRKINRMFRRLKLHKRPEVRQLREQIAGEIIDEMGLDAELFQGLRGSDLEKKINECVHENIDLILDTRGIADSVLRRTANTDTQKIAKLRNLRRGLRRVASMNDEDEWLAKVGRVISAVDSDIEDVLLGGDVTRTSFDSPLMTLLGERNIGAAYLMLLGDDA